LAPSIVYGSANVTANDNTPNKSDVDSSVQCAQYEPLATGLTESPKRATYGKDSFIDLVSKFSLLFSIFFLVHVFLFHIVDVVLPIRIIHPTRHVFLPFVILNSFVSICQLTPEAPVMSQTHCDYRESTNTDSTKYVS
jgi:hypothetical protein